MTVVRFNPKARLDARRVSDRTGGGRPSLRIPSRRAGSSGSGRTGGGVAVGGGASVVVVLIVVILSQVAGVDLAGIGGSQTAAGSGFDTDRFEETERYASCRTGADAQRSADCARVAVENSLVDFWGDQLGSGFQPAARLVTFTGSVSTRCGAASSDVGPFYCPADTGIYLDTGFFDEVLERRLGGPDGGFVEAYVLAHEYGHHISNITGQFRRVRTRQGPQSDAVRLELQADCYAGMWTRAATTTEDAQGNVLFEELTQQDIQLALEAAATVGDDRIQERTSGQVSPESWTHGSAEQRQRWFRTGLSRGSVEDCDTFGANRV